MADANFRLNTADLEQQFTEFCRRFEELFRRPDQILSPVWELVAEMERNGIDPIEPQRVPRPLPEPFLNQWTDHLSIAITTGRHYLPLVYDEAFVRPLLRNLGHLVRSSDDPATTQDIAETLVGAVAQHTSDSPVRQPLRQFLAVVSNLYRSFLASDKRVTAELPLAVPVLPPLCAFHFDVLPDLHYGPAVFTAPKTRLLCGSDVAVVVMPATFSRTPLAWIPLAHEAAGHGVLQADPGMVPDLIDGIRALFGGGSLPPGREPKLSESQIFGLLWSHWAEETASDVYGLLNVGPAFALNLAAFLAAKRTVSKSPDFGAADPPFPRLAVRAGDDRRTDLGVHPVDLLRLYVLIGAIESLADLASETRRDYVSALNKIARLCSRNAWQNRPRKERNKIIIRGRVDVARERAVSIEESLDLKVAAESARRVGAFIASTRLGALNNQTIQDIETWDDGDEFASRSIAAELHESLENPRVRMILAQQEVVMAIPDALKARIPTITGQRIAEIVEHLKADQFEELDKQERIVLGLGGLDAEGIEALKHDKIEALIPSVARALDLDRIERLGDDGQLLAGATLAAMRSPSVLSFRWINRRLAHALNCSHRNDSIMGFASVHSMFDDDVATPTWFSLDPREAGSEPEGHQPV